MNQTLDDTLAMAMQGIEKAVTADALFIYSVIEQNQFKKGGKLKPSDFSEVLARIKDEAFYVAKIAGTIVGFVRINEYGGQTGKDIAEIRSWYVLPEHNDKKIGTALLEVAEQEAKKRGYNRVHIVTQKEDFGKERGYVQTSVPEQKVMKDCKPCPLYNNGCNETAFVKTLQPLQLVQLKP